MWTGLVALETGLRNDEVAYRHLSFASCRCFSVAFSIHRPNTRNAFVLWRQLLPRFQTLLCSHVLDIVLASHHVNLRALTSRSGELSASKGPLVAQISMHRGLRDRAATCTQHSALSHGEVWNEAI